MRFCGTPFGVRLLTLYGGAERGRVENEALRLRKEARLTARPTGRIPGYPGGTKFTCLAGGV